MGIGKGLFSFDDYERFGSLYDCVASKGAVNISYSPKKNQVTIMARAKDKDEILKCIDSFEVIGIKEWHNMVWIKVKI